MSRKYIQNRIRDLGFTQRSVSMTIGVSEQSLSNFINGSRSYSYRMYISLLMALALTVDNPIESIGKRPATALRETIREAIEARDMSIRKLAGLCKVNSTSLSSYLTGKRSISVTALERVIAGLNLGFVSYGIPTVQSVK